MHFSRGRKCLVLAAPLFLAGLFLLSLNSDPAVDIPQHHMSPPSAGNAAVIEATLPTDREGKSSAGTRLRDTKAAAEADVDEDANEEMEALQARIRDLEDQLMEKDTEIKTLKTTKSPNQDTKPAPSKPSSDDSSETGEKHSVPPHTTELTNVRQGEETTHRCQMFGAWGDFCVYENLCFDTNVDLVFISEKPFRRASSSKSGVKFTTKLPVKEPDEERFRPTLYGGTVRSITKAELAKANAEWVDTSNGALYVTSYTQRLANIWFYSTRVLPLFVADFYREMLGLPPMGHVIIPMEEKKVTHKWHQGTMNISLPDPKPRLHFADTQPYLGLRADKLICAKHAVLLGAQVYGFPDFVSAHEFKTRAYKAAGLPAPPIQQDEHPVVPKKVVILDRGRNKPRHINNIEEVKDLIESYGVEMEHVVLGDEDDFLDQVKLFAGTGVLLTVHGAGLMNQVFMPPGSATIEVFPNHVKHVLYERIAHYSGVYHFKVYAREHTSDFVNKYDGYFRHNCPETLSMEVPEAEGGYCWRIVKNTAVIVPIPELEVALVNALDFFTRTRLKSESRDGEDN